MVKFFIKKPCIFNIVLLASITLISGCTQRKAGYVDRFAKRKASGMVEGKTWKYRYAYVDPTLSTGLDSDYMFIFLPYKPKTPCPRQGEIPSSVATIQVAAPKVSKKTTKLRGGTPRALGFMPPVKGGADPMVADQGRFQIRKLKGKTIRGRLLAKYDNENWINGDFKARMCDIAEMEDEPPVVPEG